MITVSHPTLISREKGMGFKMVSKQVVLREQDIEPALNQICEQLLRRHPQLKEMVLVGSRTGGVFLAERQRQGQKWSCLF